MRERWINVAKCMAIFAVMTDHVNGVLYTNQRIATASYFSVSLFILLMGITTFWSFDASKVQISKKVFLRLIGILIPYAVSVFIYYIVVFRSFNWLEYRNYFLNFNISGPHYYVLLYIQLIAIAPVMFYCLRSLSHVHTNRKVEHIFEVMFGGGDCSACVCNY